MSQDDILKFLYNKRKNKDLSFYSVKQICKALKIKYPNSGVCVAVKKLNNRGVLELKSDLKLTPRLYLKRFYRLNMIYMPIMKQRYILK